MNTNESFRNLNSYLTYSVVDGLVRNLGLENIGTASYGDLMSRLYEFQSNALLCIDGQRVQRDVLLQAKKTGVSIVGWVTEDPFDLEFNLGNQDLYDTVFTNEISTVPEYAEGKARYLPLGASEDLCGFPVRSDLWYDVCIAGTAWPERVEFCKHLVDRLPDLRWKIILATNDVIRDYDFTSSKAETNVRYSIKDLCRIYNHSAITINLRRTYTLGPKREALSPPPRVFETALAGTAQMVQTVENDILDQYFLPGIEIETFGDVDECCKKIRDILKDADRRYKLALAAQRRAVAEHVYAVRVIPILNWIREHGNTPKKSKPKRNLLICVHNYVEQRPFGGVEILTERLVRYLKHEWNVYLLYPSNTDAKWYLQDSKTAIRSETPLKVISRYETLSAASPYEALEFKKILLQKEISLVYFQHLLNYPLLLPLSASELGIPFILSFHDYYPICHKFNLVDLFNAYCHPHRIPLESCDVCLQRSLGAQIRRRELIAKVLKKACGIHCVSSWQKTLIASIYPEFEQRLQVIEPGCEEGTPPETLGWNRKLRVVVPGNIGFHKGAAVLSEVTAYFAGVHGDKIEFFIPFSVQSPWKENMARLGNVLFGTRTYDVGEQLDIYKGADVALFLSIWPETFLISLSEAWRMRLPAIVTDLGAPSNRVQDGVNGWKVPPNQAGPAINILNRILDDRSLLETVRNNLKRTKVTTSGDYCRHIEAFLEKALENASVPSNLKLTRSQVAWLESQLDGCQPMIIPWSQQVIQLSQRVVLRRGMLILEAYRYLRKFGIKMFLAAALMYLSRKLGKVSVEEADRFAYQT